LQEGHVPRSCLRWLMIACRDVIGNDARWVKWVHQGRRACELHLRTRGMSCKGERVAPGAASSMPNVFLRQRCRMQSKAQHPRKHTMLPCKLRASNLKTNLDVVILPLDCHPRIFFEHRVLASAYNFRKCCMQAF